MELTEISLCRIDDMNPKLNAFLTVTADQAMEAARQAEKGGDAGRKTRPSARHSDINKRP